MSTPTAQGSKPTPRSSGAGFTPSAASPPRSVASPSHLGSAYPKAGKSPHKIPAAAAAHLAQGNAAYGSSPLAAAHTPTPLNHATPAAANTSSPADGSAGRNRAGTFGGKSGLGSEAGTPALSGLAGLGLFGGGLGSGGGMTAPMDNAAMLDAIAGDVDANLRSAEAFRQRLREVTSILATRWGRVCQDSLVAVVPRLGLEGMWDDSGRDNLVKSGQSRNYIIAGKAFSVEIDWYEGRVKTVVLDLPNARDAAKRSLGRAAEILRKDLVGWNGEAEQGRYVDLAPFAANLQRLAKMDQLGAENASCFDAIEGLYASLSKIWDWEMDFQDKPDDPRLQKGAEVAVMCGWSGRPAMHTNRDIGLKLDYWLDRRRAYLRTYSATSATPAAADERFGKGDNLWSLLIDCEACAQGTYTPIRISDDWVAEPVGKLMEPVTGALSPTQINWAEPPALPVAEEDQQDPMDIDATLRQSAHSAVRFAVRFSPPVVLPYAVAAQIGQLVGVNLPPEPLQSYLALLFADADGSSKETSSEPSAAMGGDEIFTFTRTVASFDAQGVACPHTYRYRLQTSGPLAGRVMTEIPFYHPSQLVAIMPYLRQWACVGQILRRSSGLYDENLAEMEEGTQQPIAQEPEPGSSSNARPPSPPSDTDSEDDGGAMPKSSTLRSRMPPQKPEHDFDITMSATNTRVDLDCAPLFGIRRGGVRITPNGKVEVELEGEELDDDELEEPGSKDGGRSQASESKSGEKANGEDDMQLDERKDAKGGKTNTTMKTPIRVLEFSEDLGVLAAWMHAHSAT